MGQPPPPNGPQGPYPGQPGQPPQGPPPGFGQQPPQGPPGQYPPQGMPPQGPPPGYGQAPQGPPPGYGQHPPQGPPGQFPPQGPPGQYPPGYGPQGPGPGAPKKKTGLIIGGAAAAVLLVVAIGGALIFANSGGEYVSLPDCSEAIDSSVFDPFFESGAPALSGEFDPDEGTLDSSYGTLNCSGESRGVRIEVNAELVDLDDPEVEREFEEVFDGTELTDDFMKESAQPGEVTEEDLGLGMTASFLWDHTNVGDQSIVLAMSSGAGEDLAELADLPGMPSTSNSLGVGIFMTDNIVGGFVVNDSEGGYDVQDLFDTVDSVNGDLAKELRRVAD